MDIKTITDSIFADDKYKSMCKKISSESQWEDLYQEFAVLLLDKNNAYHIMNARNIEVYCYGMIMNLWNRRTRKKHHKDSSTSSLYMIGNNEGDWQDYNFEIKSNLSKEDQSTIIKLKQELKRLLTSDNKKTRKQAEILKAFCEGKNRLEISKETGINYKIVHEAIEEAKNIIYERMTGTKVITKNDITLKLRAEGGKPVYSGKDKTFYSEKVSDETKSMIEKAGFKVCKK